MKKFFTKHKNNFKNKKVLNIIKLNFKWDKYNYNTSCNHKSPVEKRPKKEEATVSDFQLDDALLRVKE